MRLFPYSSYLRYNNNTLIPKRAPPGQQPTSATEAALDLECIWGVTGVFREAVWSAALSQELLEAFCCLRQMDKWDHPPCYHQTCDGPQQGDLECRSVFWLAEYYWAAVRASGQSWIGHLCFMYNEDKGRLISWTRSWEFQKEISQECGCRRRLKNLVRWLTTCYQCNGTWRRPC